MPDEFDPLHELERRDRETNAIIRKMIADKEGERAAREFDAKIKDIRSGIDTVRMTWHSISQAQRTALLFAEQWGGLSRYSIKPSQYRAANGRRPDNPIRLTTVRNLIARELVECIGGAFDPEQRVVVTERGRFVIRYGSLHSCQTCAR